MKRVIHIGMAGLVLAVGIVFVSCQDGIFEGTSGGGNLIITGLSGFNGQYIEVDGSSGGTTIGFKSSAAGSARIKISGGKVSAPVYNQSSFEQFKGNGNFTVNIKIYRDNTTSSTVSEQRAGLTVHFYSGGALL